MGTEQRLRVSRRSQATTSKHGGYSYRGVAYFTNRVFIAGVSVCAVRFVSDGRWWIVSSSTEGDRTFKARGPYSLRVAASILRLAS